MGRGLAEWDAAVAPRPQPGDVGLVDPDAVDIAVIAADVVYLDANGTSTPGPTPRLQVTVQLPAGTPPPPGGETVYPLREFGLFGELDGGPCMINYVRHPVIHKAAGDTLVRTIRLEF